MAKILNIGGLTKTNESRVIVIEGVKHEMKELSVSDFIYINDKAQAEDANPDSTFATKLKFLMESIRISFPTCSEEDLGKQSIEALYAIAAFARDGSLPEGMVDEVQAEEGALEEKKLAEVASNQ
jgi:hypothetical protein